MQAVEQRNAVDYILTEAAGLADERRAAREGTRPCHSARPDHSHLCGLPLVLPGFSKL